MRRLLTAMCLAVLAGCGPQPLMTPDEIGKVIGSPSNKVAYGPGPSQFAELWRPLGRGGRNPPVVALIHGGCWQSEYGLDLMRPMAEALAQEGYLVWNIEYRRLGEPGGGYPGTFQDVAAALDKLKALGESRAMQLDRLVVVGHSAGGHLALWASARGELPTDSPLRTADPLVVPAVLSLGGVGDLPGAAKDPTFSGACGADTIGKLVGEGTRPDPYADTSPSRLPSLEVRQVMAHGDREQITPVALGEAYAAAVNAEGGRVEVETLKGAGHFEVISPHTGVWGTIRDRIEALSRPG